MRLDGIFGIPTARTSNLIHRNGEGELLSADWRILIWVEAVMYCNYCGKVIQDDANLCAYCGKRVGAVLARKRLMRPRAERKIAGVCAGMAEYFDLDITLVRVLWIVITFFTGIVFGVVGYIVAWIVMPEEPEHVPVVQTPQQVTNP
jgi:phage shock protein C